MHLVVLRFPFGFLLAPFTSPLAPFRVPLAPFWQLLGSFLLPLGSFFAPLCSSEPLSVRSEHFGSGWDSNDRQNAAQATQVVQKGSENHLSATM